MASVVGCQTPTQQQGDDAGRTRAGQSEASLTADKTATEDEITVGILHSLSGTMALSETSLKDIALMAIEEINEEGGLLGKTLRPIVADPGSDWPLFSEHARQLIHEEEVAAIFGCWTSVARKSVLPEVEDGDALLFYPVQYEGEESSFNVFYTGAAPNQQAIPGVEYLLSPQGGSKRRFFLLGTDYVYPRTTNAILRGFLLQQGIQAEDIVERYVEFGHRDFTPELDAIGRFAAAGNAAVVSTINGDSNLPFYEQLAARELSSAQLPVLAFSIGEEELRFIDPTPLQGHLAVWSYFMSIATPDNARFIARFRDFSKRHHLPDAETRITNDPMVATYLGIHLWKQAVEQAGTTEVSAVRQAMYTQSIIGPGGHRITVDGATHHLRRPVLVGQINAAGHFDVVWRSEGLVTATPYSPYLPGNSKRGANWLYPDVCGDCRPTSASRPHHTPTP